MSGRSLPEEPLERVEHGALPRDQQFSGLGERHPPRLVDLGVQRDRHERADRRALGQVRDRAHDLARRARTDLDLDQVDSARTGAVLALAYPDRVGVRRSQPGQFQLRTGSGAWVAKDDGLAAGKGVVVTSDRDVARAHAATLLDDGHPVLLESFLDGPEVSLFCLVDGATVVPLLPAQDFKRVGDNDSGPNTGGMGAYAPLPWLPDSVVGAIVRDVVEPVAAEILARGCPFSGLLYAGMAITSAGPAVVEFNCRFGDPETQAVLALLESPLGELLYATATGTLAAQPPLRWRDGYAVTVVLAAENYPGRPRVGDVITGADTDGVLHAGTTLRDRMVVSSGGRVLSVVGTGEDLAAARAEAYRILEGIRLPGSHFRRDIGLRAQRGEITIPIDDSSDQ